MAAPAGAQLLEHKDISAAQYMVEHCLAKDPFLRPTAAQLLAGLSEPPPVAYPPPHPATELAAGGPVVPRGHAPERVPTASRPELRFDRPMASPVPP